MSELIWLEMSLWAYLRLLLLDRLFCHGLCRKALACLHPPIYLPGLQSYHQGIGCNLQLNNECESQCLC